MPELEENTDALQTVLSAGALAGRLANTAELLTIWASALDNGDDECPLCHRLKQAAHQLDQAVEALTEVDHEVEVPVTAGAIGVKPAAPHSAEPQPAEPQMAGDPAPAAADDTADPSAKAKDPRSPFLRHESIITTASEGAFALRGRSELVSLIEFVGFVANLNKDGMLQIQSPSEDFVLQIEQGCIVFATGQNPPGLRLRELLIERQAVSPDDLDRAVEECRKDEYLGEAIVRLGVAQRSDLAAALAYQITHMFCRMHSIGAGFNFQFEEGTRVLLEPDVRIRVSHLLLESSRIVDEQNRANRQAATGESGIYASGVRKALGYDAEENKDTSWMDVLPQSR